MSKSLPIRTIPRADSWANQRKGSDWASKLHPTGKEAQRPGHASAQRECTEYLIHSRNIEPPSRSGKLLLIRLPW